jgi:hypothetical protein
MWTELVKRMAYANIYSVNKDLTYQDVINLMAEYEREFADKIEVDNIAKSLDKEEKEEIKD